MDHPETVVTFVPTKDLGANCVHGKPLGSDSCVECRAWVRDYNNRDRSRDLTEECYL